MKHARALLLALALEAAPAGARQVRFRRPKTAFVATLVLDPRAVRLVGFLEGTDGVDLLWQQGGRVRILPA